MAPLFRLINRVQVSELVSIYAVILLVINYMTEVYINEHDSAL